MFDSAENNLMIIKSGLINPESYFIKLWSIVVIILLLYTATIMPYNISFVD
jgi:hypothetical protein